MAAVSREASEVHPAKVLSKVAEAELTQPASSTDSRAAQSLNMRA